MLRELRGYEYHSLRRQVPPSSPLMTPASFVSKLGLSSPFPCLRQKGHGCMSAGKVPLAGPLHTSLLFLCRNPESRLVWIQVSKSTRYSTAVVFVPRVIQLRLNCIGVDDPSIISMHLPLLLGLLFFLPEWHCLKRLHAIS